MPRAKVSKKEVIKLLELELKGKYPEKVSNILTRKGLVNNRILHCEITGDMKKDIQQKYFIVTNCIKNWSVQKHKRLSSQENIGGGGIPYLNARHKITDGKWISYSRISSRCFFTISCKSPMKFTICNSLLLFTCIIYCIFVKFVIYLFYLLMKF